MAAFTDEDKARIRYHLKYPNVTEVAYTVGGVQFAGAAQYTLDFAMDHVDALAIPQVQNVLDILDTIETQMVDALARLRASKADVVTLNPNEHADLQGQYAYWQNNLSNQLSVPVNPYAIGSAVGTLNMRVSR